MSRVYAPAMVGNDVIVKLNKKITQQPKPEPINSIGLAPQAMPEESIAPESKGAYSNLSTLSLEPAVLNGQSPFVMQSSINYGKAILTRTTVGMVVTPIVLAVLLSGLVLYRSQLHTLASDTKYIAKQLVVDVSNQAAPKKPVINTQQITIPSSDVNSATSAIVSQQITINLGSTSVSVNASSIVSWLSIHKQGSKTTMSVNKSQITNYLNGVVSANSKAVVNRVILNKGYGVPLVEAEGQNGMTVQYSQAGYNQIVNNLFKANGITVNLPTKVVPYQTTVKTLPRY